MNCLTRSLAHLLGTPVEEVPDLTPLLGSDRAFWACVEDWLQSRGLACAWIEDPSQARALRGSYIVLLRDGAAGWHAVVYRDGELEFDPSAPRPTARVAGVLLLYPLRVRVDAGRPGRAKA